MVVFGAKLFEPTDFALHRDAGQTANAMLTIVAVSPKSVVTFHWNTKRRITDRRFRLAKGECKTLSLGGHEFVVHNNGRKADTVRLSFDAPEIVVIYRLGFKGTRYDK